jgi:uncharacterized membrane protein YeiB
MKKKEEIFSGVKLPGIPMLLFNILLLFAIIGFFVWLVNASLPVWLSIVGSILLVLVFVFNCIAWVGFMQIEPNEARVMTFFGKYEGTSRITVIFG